MGCCTSLSTGLAARPGGLSAGSKRLLEEYSVGPTLGEGAFGVVYLCTKRSTGEEVAVKMVDKVETPVDAIKREAEMLRSMSHYNIVKFHQVFFERCFVCIVMDKYTGGDLVEGLQLHLKERGTINCHDIVHVSAQMGAAVHYLHDKSIVHRDIKGDNYLMDRKNITDPKCRVVLTDFGTAVTIKPGERLTSEVGTRIFWAPEFFNRNYGLKVDVWAMGIIMYGLLDGRFPFKGEHDIKKKEPKIPKRVHPDCLDYLKRMLCKDEAKRISAAEITTHAWITSNKHVAGNVSVCTTPVEERPSTGRQDRPEDPATLRQDHANDGVKERRRELVERLNNEHRGKKEGQRKEASAHFLAKWFTINDRSTGCTFRFEWWDEHRVESSGVAKIEGIPRGTQASELNRSPEIIGQMLTEQNIDINKFGVGDARTLWQLADEVQRGAARLMLDAAAHKKIVRVVDVILLRFYTAPKDGKILVEAGEQFPDGRKRAIHRLPGTKKDPHENSREAAGRILQDILQMGSVGVQFNFDDKEVFEEEMISPSFPGVRTVYRKEIIQGHITSGDPVLLGRKGLPQGHGFRTEDSKKTVKFFEWMTEKQALAHKVKLKADSSESASALVMAPIGMNEEDLRTYLETNHVDVSRFGKNHAKTLKEFSSELMKGESSLMKDQNSGVVRNVELVILRILSPSGNDLLIQTEQTFTDGTKTKLDRLPGTKRRPDESQFLTARRILRRQLKIDENQVKLNNKTVKYFEEEKPSPGFPGIRTVYRKCIITAELLKNKP